MTDREKAAEALRADLVELVAKHLGSRGAVYDVSTTINDASTCVCVFAGADARTPTGVAVVSLTPDAAVGRMMQEPPRREALPVVA